MTRLDPDGTVKALDSGELSILPAPQFSESLDELLLAVAMRSESGAIDAKRGLGLRRGSPASTSPGMDGVCSHSIQA
jgi:hypothetical protein